MNDAWLPRIICVGLIGLSAECIFSASRMEASEEKVIMALLFIASNVVSGLLGYVANAANPEKQK